LGKQHISLPRDNREEGARPVARRAGEQGGGKHGLSESVLQFDAAVKDAKFDLTRIYDNTFVEKALGELKN
jgi:hypothetical protein